MQKIKYFAFILYPVAVAITLAIIFSEKESRAGKIRKIYLSENKAAVITLAYNRSTSISFFEKPERVAPGSPDNLIINFIGKDLNIVPRGHDLGNLHVYTKTGSYVILFELGTKASYDDRVEVEIGKNAATTRPMNLMEDTFHTELFEIQITQFQKNKSKSLTANFAASLSSKNQKIESSELLDILEGFKNFRCEGCTIKPEKELLRISCIKPIIQLRCKSLNAKILLRKLNP